MIFRRVVSLLTVLLLMFAATTQASWVTLFSEDFESDTIGTDPTGFDVLVEDDEGDISVVDGSVDGASAAIQAPISGDAMRVFDPNNNSPVRDAAWVTQNLGQNYGILRLDVDARWYNTGSAVTPFRITLSRDGLSGTDTLSGSRRPVDVFLKMAGAGIEARHQTAGVPAASTTDASFGFFDGGASGNTFQDETISISIIANSHTTDSFTYNALNGIGSVTLAPKTFHVYVEGSGAPGVGILPPVPATPHTLFGNDPGNPSYLWDRSATDGENFYDDDAELGSFSILAHRDEGPFDFVFDNFRASTFVIPEPGSLALCLIGGVLLLVRRRK